MFLFGPFVFHMSDGSFDSQINRHHVYTYIKNCLPWLFTTIPYKRTKYQKIHVKLAKKLIRKAKRLRTYDFKTACTHTGAEKDIDQFQIKGQFIPIIPFNPIPMLYCTNQSGIASYFNLMMVHQSG